MKGLIFNIQPYSLHDGPGIRTIVFLKGCPLRCRWCSNPESQLKTPQVYLDRTKCIRESGCNLCDQSCPAGALHDGILEHSLCDHCGKCAGICPSQALGVYGKWVEADEVIDLIEKDSVFYAHGKGGLTLSGGEPFAQAEFALELLKEAKKRRIHTAVETCGSCSREVLREAAGYLDYILYDVKCMDPKKHETFTGLGNTEILSNLEMLFCEYEGVHKHIRTPVIPGFNDTEEEIRSIRSFLDGRSNCTYELLPYHRFGERKYELLGRRLPNLPKELDTRLFQRLKANEIQG